MKSHFLKSFIILKILLLATMVSCSFKKSESVSPQPQVKVISKDASPIDVEELMSAEDQKYIWDRLLFEKDTYLATSAQRQRALDSAIKMSKYDVIKEMLVYGVNPFKINQDSYGRIDMDSGVGSLLVSSQNIVIGKLRSAYPIGEDGERAYVEFRQLVNSSELGLRGCQSLVDSVLNLKYFGSDLLSERQIPVQNAVEEILEKTDCKHYVQSFSIEMVQKWLSLEFYDQFQNNFSSIELMQFLKQLRPVRSLNIVLPNVKTKMKQFGSVASTQLKVDPMAMLFLKLPCVNGKSHQWYAMVEELRKDIGSDYHFRISTEGGDALAECIDERVNECYGHGNNLMELYVLFNLIISDKQMSYDEFKRAQLQVISPRLRFDNEILPQHYNALCSEQVW